VAYSSYSDESSDESSSASSSASSSESSSESSDDSEESGGEGVPTPHWKTMKLKIGHLCVATLGEGEGYLVGEVVALLPVVWVDGSDAVGDVEIHEFGGNKSQQGPYEPMYEVVGKKTKGKNGSAGSYNLVGKNGKPPPNNPKCTPVCTTIWCECIVAWGKEAKILTPKRKLTANVTDDLN
jgi:hypothetical protein